MRKKTPTRTLIFAFGFGLAWMWPSTAASQSFTDDAIAAGLEGVSGTYGAAWGDYDADGCVDLFVSGDNLLFSNNCDGTFADGVFLGGESGANRGAHWGDHDNDGDLDLILTRGPYVYLNCGDDAFLLQDNGSIGFTDTFNLADVGFIDYNEDGLLDVWAPVGQEGYNQIFENDGDGTFTSQGLDALGLTPSGNGEVTAVADYDGDGHTDILYRYGNGVLWHADGDGSFTNVSDTAGITLSSADGGRNGNAFGDYDNDGDLDLYGGQNLSNRLYRNEGVLPFSDVSVVSGAGGGGVANTRGVAFGDFDNDGFLDLYVSNSNANNQLFHNERDGTFTDVANTYGLTVAGQSSGAVWADYDNDGDLDLFVVHDTQSALFTNELNDDDYLKVIVLGGGAGYSPRDGTGRRIELWNSAGTTLLAIREIVGGEGYGSHGPRLAHFGLANGWGGGDGTYQVRVRFNGGVTATRSDIVPSAESIVVGTTVLSQTIAVVEPRANGQPCDSAVECVSEQCFDGVCCDNPCGGGCEACSLEAGADDDGLCSVIDADAVCRDSAGICDAEEVCDGISGECPDDDMVPYGNTCRTGTTLCDAVEICDGINPECPDDNVATEGTVCRLATDLCDVTETCDGVSADCPTDDKAVGGTVCRPAADLCDAIETCSGVSVSCPDDALSSSGTVCRSASDLCDAVEVCDGISRVCPIDSPASAGTTCRVAVDVCDTRETCDGVSMDCPENVFLSDGEDCSDGVVCNGSETCLAGICTDGPHLNCGDDNICTTDFCVEPGGCGFQVFNGCCVTDDDCADGDACTLENCIESENLCELTMLDGCCSNDRNCDDEDPCTVDVCSGPGETCQHLPISNCCELDGDCDDTVDCTVDTCDVDVNSCLFTPLSDCCDVDSDCENNDLCTDDTCTSDNGTCSSDTIADCCSLDGDCHDEDVCTTDSCSGPGGVCDHVAIEHCCVSDNDCPNDDLCRVNTCNLNSYRCEAVPIEGCCTTDDDCLEVNSDYDCVEVSCNTTTYACAFKALRDCCELDSDCDDMDSCTFDTCVDTACSHSRLPECELDAGTSDISGASGIPDDGGCTCIARGSALPSQGFWLAICLFGNVVLRRRSRPKKTNDSVS